MKILVVDDELPIREGLRQMIGELFAGEPGFSAPAVSEGGAEALAHLASNRVDLVITDVKMPGMDGLALIERARSLYPHLVFIVLSGFVEFDYVHRALRLGAIDFLLKPVDREALRASLGRAAASYEYRAQGRIHIDADRFRGLPGEWPVLIALDIRCDAAAPGAGAAACIRSTEAMIDERSGCYILHGFPVARAENVVIGVRGDTKAAAEDRAARLSRDLASAFAEQFGCAADAGASPAESGADPYALYLQACRALFRRVAAADAGAQGRPVGGRPEPADTSRIDAAWDTLDFNALIREAAEAIRRAAARQGAEALERSVNALLLTVSEHIKRISAEPFISAYDLSNLLVRLLWCRDVEGLTGDVTAWLASVLEGLLPEKREGQAIARAKQYIRTHLSEPISLADIGREVCMSTFYLSRLFRERTGITFIEYCTAEKIEMAKSLLAEPGVKVYEVAERIGYSSWKHFSRTFKEVTGLSPAEYRQNRIG